jgi:HK97 family phage portal protein
VPLLNTIGRLPAGAAAAATSPQAPQAGPAAPFPTVEQESPHATKAGLFPVSFESFGGGNPSGAMILARSFAPNGMGTGSGWTSDRHAEGLMYRGWVYIAVRALAQEIAQRAPVSALLDRGAGDEPEPAKRASGWWTKALNSDVARGTDEVKPLPWNHPLPRLLSNPNGPDTSFEFWYEHEMFMGINGLAYWWVIRNGFGVPVELWILPPAWVTPRWGTTPSWVSHYEVRPYGAARPFVIAADDVIAFKAKHPWEKRDGYSPLVAGNLWVDSSNSIDRTRLAAFKNGSAPSIAVELGEKYGDPTQQAIDRIYEKYFARISGEMNAGRPVITPPGAKVHQLTGVSPQEMGYNESGNTIRDMVLSLFGVPYTIAMIVGGATFENNQESRVAFHQNTINPKLRWYGQVITEKLAKPNFDDSAVVFWEDATPVDAAQRNADMQADFAMGAITPDEVRQERGKPPVEGGIGKHHLAPAGLVKLEHVIDPPEAGEPGGPPEPKPELPAKGLPWWHSKVLVRDSLGREQEHDERGRFGKGGAGSGTPLNHAEVIDLEQLEIGRQEMGLTGADAKKHRALMARYESAGVAAGVPRSAARSLEKEMGGGGKRPTPTSRVPAPHLSEKAKLAKQFASRITAVHQRFAEEFMEAHVAKALGGVSLPDSENCDIVIPKTAAVRRKLLRERDRREKLLAAATAAGKKRPKFEAFNRLVRDSDIAHKVELKTPVKGEQGAIYIKGEAKKSKQAWQKKTGKPIHVVVVDARAAFSESGSHDLSMVKVYYRRGANKMYYGGENSTMHEVGGLGSMKKKLRALIKTPTAELEAIAPKAMPEAKQRKHIRE